MTDRHRERIGRIVVGKLRQTDEGLDHASDLRLVGAPAADHSATYRSWRILAHDKSLSCRDQHGDTSGVSDGHGRADIAMDESLLDRDGGRSVFRDHSLENVCDRGETFR